MGKILLKSDLQNIQVLKKSGYVTRSVSYSTVNENDLLKRAAENSQIGMGTLKATLRALIKEFRNCLLNGHGVEMSDLGTLQYIINAHSTNDAEESGEDQVYRRKLTFTPSARLIERLSSIELAAVGEE